MHAWIAEVERKLGKRTRVFLALTVIAIGIAGASLYLAIDARNSSVSESDVQKLQEELETRIDESSGTAIAPTAPPVETTPTPESTPTPPSEGQGSKPKNEGKNGGGGNSGASGGDSSGTSGGATDGAANSAKLQELLEQAKKRSAANE